MAIMLVALIGQAMNPEARRSFRALTERAEGGDAEAQYRLAGVYRTGYDSIPADTARWVSLLRLSAGQDYAPAQNMLGYLYAGGTGVKADRDSAYMWIKRAADSGDATAASNIGYMLLEEAGGKQREAAGYLQQAAEGGVPQAMSLLADLYRDGRGVERDTVKAQELYTRAYAAGLADAELRLMNMMMPRWLRELTPAEQVQTGKEYYLAERPMRIVGVELMEHGVAATPAGKERGEAYRLLGDAYSTGRGALYNHDKGMEYYRRAAADGDEKAARIIEELLQIFPDSF